MKLTVLVLSLILGVEALFKQRLHPNDMRPIPNAASSDPVFVTPMLPNDFLKAQNYTRVSGIPNWNTSAHEMHTGFITIDPNTSSNTFFWFSKSLDGNASAPVLLWLQGGPGASSMFGMFTEIGPFNIDQNMTAVPRAVNWNQHYHLLFLDNPLGKSYSTLLP